ncbi:hypothetical protein, partial [Rhodococcus triatomae]
AASALICRATCETDHRLGAGAAVNALPIGKSPFPADVAATSRPIALTPPGWCRAPFELESASTWNYPASAIAPPLISFSGTRITMLKLDDSLRVELSSALMGDRRRCSARVA